MSHAPRTPSWISRLRADSARPQAEPDWADLGTAYGLEQSMQSVPDEAPPAVADASSTPRGRGWTPRWMRGKPAAR